jgi:hypothetical protein
MKHEKHPWFIRDSNPVPLGLKSGALTTELPGHLTEKGKTSSIYSKKQSVDLTTLKSYSSRFQKSTKFKILLKLVFNYCMNKEPSSRDR